MKSGDNKETYKIKLFYRKKEFDLSINSNYDETLAKIYKILNLNANSLLLSYYDEYGDNILIFTEKDYSIFLKQVKTNLVKSLIIELNDKSNENNINEYSNYNTNDFNNIIFFDNEKDNQIGKNINNNNIINNYELFNDNGMQNSSISTPKKDNNDDERIEDKIYYYKCDNCDEYPILFEMFYCSECNLYLCKNCGITVNNHFHQLLKIDSQDKLYKIKEEENEKIENRKKFLFK